MNETYHLFTTETDRGRTSSISYGCDKHGGKDRKELRGSGHTAGFYTINASGKVLPPLYLFDSSTPNSGNYHTQSSWYKKLSKLCYLSYHFNYLLIIKQLYITNLFTYTKQFIGRYGLEVKIILESFNTVRSKLRMDDSVFNYYIINIVLPLYLNIF